MILILGFSDFKVRQAEQIANKKKGERHFIMKTEGSDPADADRTTPTERLIG